MSDLEDVAGNYDELNRGGESWDSIVNRVEGVGDHRLAAFLRQRAAGDSTTAVTEPPVERSGGQKSVAAQEADDAAKVAETPEQVAAELAAEGGTA